ncbi:TonB-dependent outer membrane receptor [Nonlabens dokdonensis DSW-6]|uniref:TonB-dependent outer membrane receptor n=1 Tax=Nonlabens dokdonensis (strain DSM 17205 / KCTC 12402 / DSW-6) TaxID=592029 RepID=L7W3D5_NONDD|nr:TonB-dependent outer membrane receptor [Nonlabens dokdonensis DSW-6]
MNEVTKEPLPSVAVYNKDKSVSTITDFDGVADLKKFSKGDRIYFQSMAFETFAINKSEIKKVGQEILMKPRSEEINPIVISASKFEQRKQDIPQKIISQSAKDVTTNNPQTSADLLQQSGQVYVQKSQQGGGSPLIRGFSTNRLLITVDGVRMNNAIFRGGNLQNVISIDPLSISRTEVILGPGSVVYGSDAIGGVMNFYTKKPQLAQDSLAFTGNALIRYATANDENTAHLDFNYGTSKFAAATSITINSFGDLVMGSHGPEEYLRNQYVARINGRDEVINNQNPERQVSTGFDQINLLQKFKYRPNQKWDFDLGIIYTATSDFDRYDILTRLDDDGNPRNAEWYYGPQTWLMGTAKATHRGNGKWYDKMIISQAFQQFEESRNDRSFREPELFQNKEQVDVFTTSVDFERRNRENNVLFYGAEFFHNRVNSVGSVFDIETEQRAPAPSRYPDNSSWRSLAAYANYQWRVDPKLVIQSGLRYNHIWLDAQFDDQFYDFPFTDANLSTGALTGALGATYLPDETWELRANFSTAFRAPNIDDKGKLFDPNPGTVIVPNPNLESEYSYNSELGVKKRIGDRFTIDVAGYYTYLKDALVPRDFQLNGQDMIVYQGELSQVQAIQNAETATVYGLEIGAQYEFNDQFRIYGHYNWLNGEQEEMDGSTVPVRHVSPNFGDLHAVFKNDKWNFDAFLVFNGQFDFEDLAPSQQSRPYLFAQDENGNPYSPRWYTFNFRSNYKINDTLTAVAIVENITDQRYRTYSSGIAAAGRNLILSLQYAF